MGKMDEAEKQNKPKPEAAAKPAPEIAGHADKPGEEPGKKMTPEEQMAAFEKAMKEEDWGHQPC